METLPRRGLPRTEMMKRVAFFRDLKGSDGGLPDSKMQGCIRTLYNVIGFQPPKDEGGAVTSPVGDDAAAWPPSRFRRALISDTAARSRATAR